MKTNAFACFVIAMFLVAISCNKKKDDSNNNTVDPATVTLTSTTNGAVAGDVFYRHKSTHNAKLDAGASGTNATWDFSTLPETSKDTLRYISVASTYYPTLFTSSTVAEKYSDSGFNYYKSDASGFSFVGQKYHSNTSSQYVYCDPDMKTPFPLTYNSRYYDEAVYAVGPSACVYTYTDSIVCDGVGTLKLPTGTFTAVLRVHKFGTNQSGQAEDKGYEWYVSGHHTPLLKIDNSANGNGSGAAVYTSK